MASKVNSNVSTNTTTKKVVKSQWNPTQESIDMLRKEGEFIHFGGDKTRRSTLTGAEANKWGSDEPEAIFNTTYRISGRNPQVVYDALIAANYTPAQAREIVDDSVSASNYQTTKKAEYDAEVVARKERPKKAKKVAEEGYSISEILWFAQQLKKKGLVRIEQNVSSRKKAVSQPGRAHSGQSFAERLANLPEGKVLDVSNMDLESSYGHGARTFKIPGIKSGKVGAPGIPGLVSNKLEAYRRAVQLAYGDEGLVEHASDIAHVEGLLSGKGPVAEVPVASASSVVPPVATSSTVVVPGQTVAPAVTLQPVVTKPLVPKVGTPKVATTGVLPPQMPSLRAK